MFRTQLRRLLRDKRGNVAMMFAVSLFPMAFLSGMAIDYTIASDRQAQLNGFADAAALAAVTPTMMAQSDSLAKTAAQNTFNSQAQQLTTIAYSTDNLTVNVSTTAGKRTATVTYTAGSPTFFSTLLGQTQINLGGTATATGGLPPNINFYLMLDSSPSMGLAATTSGINTLLSNTQNQVDSQTGSKGCAFACHEVQPSKESPALKNPNLNKTVTVNGVKYKCDGTEDNYALARCLGLTLRIDLVTDAVKNLASTASTTMSTTNASYQMALYSFDVTLNTIQALTSNMTTAGSSASNVSLLTVCYNNVLYSSSVTGCSPPSGQTVGNGDNDMDTDFDQAMYKINAIMPNPGSGTKTAGDTPQEVLFIVTDGVNDACVKTSPANSYTGGGCREQYYMNYANVSGNTYSAPGGNDWCSTIKNRGIRIAVLYTTYVPMLSPPLANGYTSSWYKNFMGSGSGIKAFIDGTTDQAATALQSCASPGLFYEVQNDGDISTALSSLFNMAVQSAYLSK
jgi:Flp pilus assembly protein TadG